MLQFDARSFDRPGIPAGAPSIRISAGVLRKPQASGAALVIVTAAPLASRPKRTPSWNRIESAVETLGAERIKWVHPDCGLWMLSRSVADRKIEALAKGRDLFEGVTLG